MTADAVSFTAHAEVRSASEWDVMLAGGAEAIQAAAGVPYVALTTIDDVYPERPDR